MANTGTPISLNGNSFQTDNILTDTINDQNIPTVDAKQYPLAHANQSAMPFVSYPGRTMTFSGTLTAGSLADMDDLIDTVKGYSVGNNVTLEIGHHGGTRRYIGTITKTDITRPGGLTYGKFLFEVTCNYPWGFDTTATTMLSATGRTANSYSDDVTITSNAPQQLPIATITLTAVSGSGSNVVQWGNGSNGQVITVTSDFSNGDVIIIDCVNKEVTLNGQPIDFSGGFPELTSGDNTLQYYDDLTSRTFSINVVYTRAWL